MSIRKRIADWLDPRPQARERGRWLSEATVSNTTHEDRLWQIVGGEAATGLDLPAAERIRIVRRSRTFGRNDPLCRQAVRLWTDYGVGTGLRFQAEDAAVQEQLSRFWDLPLNRPLTSGQGQRKSSARLLIDGEVFLAVVGAPPDCVLRRVDPLEITRLLPDPEDAERILFYRREYVPAGVGSSAKVVYYRSMLVGADEEVPDVLDDGKVVNALAEPDIALFHVPLDPVGTRGTPLLQAAIPWAEAHGQFMEDRLNLIAAIARYANQLETAPGGIAAARAAVEAAANASAQTWVSPAGMGLKEAPRDTGASAARDDGELLKLQICAATGVMAHYMGDPSSGNLATATAMELPMLKQFTAYQSLWGDSYRAVFEYLVGAERLAQAGLDIDWPQMLDSDIAKLSAAVGQFSQAIPKLPKTRAVQMQVLMALGVNNVSEVLDEMDAMEDEKPQPAPVPGAAPPQGGTDDGPDGDQGDSNEDPLADQPRDQQESGLLDALRGLREALR